MTNEVLQELLVNAKESLGLHKSVFDNKLKLQIKACVSDLINRNAIRPEQVETTPVDPSITMAVMTYVGAYMGTEEEFAWLKQDYEEQKATLMMTTGYTDWEEGNGSV